MKHKLINHVILLLLILVALTAIIALTDLDRRFSSLFFDQARGFIHGSDQPWRFLYAYGEIPALVLNVAAALILLAGLFIPRLGHLRRACLFLILLYALGPGLVVNAVFKDHWGRARPTQITEFGGDQPFTQPWQPRFFQDGRSFPSGHSSVAFYMLAPAFLLRRQHPRKALAFLVGGTLFGLAMGLARIIQGGHYLSDVLWSGCLVYLIALLLSPLLDQKEISSTSSCPQTLADRTLPPHAATSLPSIGK